MGAMQVWTRKYEGKGGEDMISYVCKCRIPGGGI